MEPNIIIDGEQSELVAAITILRNARDHLAHHKDTEGLKVGDIDARYFLTNAMMWIQHDYYPLRYPETIL